MTGRELAVAGLVKHFEPLPVGQDPFRIEHIGKRVEGVALLAACYREREASFAIPEGAISFGSSDAIQGAA